MNTITFTFANHQGGGQVELSVKPQDSEKWHEVLRFTPEAGKLEASYEVPYAGKK